MLERVEQGRIGAEELELLGLEPGKARRDASHMRGHDGAEQDQADDHREPWITSVTASASRPPTTE